MRDMKFIGICLTTQDVSRLAEFYTRVLGGLLGERVIARQGGRMGDPKGLRV